MFFFYGTNIPYECHCPWNSGWLYMYHENVITSFSNMHGYTMFRKHVFETFWRFQSIHFVILRKSSKTCFSLFSLSFNTHTHTHWMDFLIVWHSKSYYGEVIILFTSFSIVIMLICGNFHCCKIDIFHFARQTKL